MPTFETPQPISVSVEIGVGDIRIAASDRTDTVVEVRPSDDTRPADVAAAQQTRVEFAGGTLTVRAPKGWKYYTPWGGYESIDVQIALPAGSHVRAEAGVGPLRCTGRLGECHCRAGVGDIQIELAGPVVLRTGGGDISVDRAAGRAEVTTGTGAVRIGRIDGDATVKNSDGDTWIGEAAGDLRVNAANGRIDVDRAQAGVSARTANGDVRLGEVARSSVVAQTSNGDLEVGVRSGVAAWLDLHTQFGRVRNALEAAGPPQPGADTVEVRARTSYGDITIRRSLAKANGTPKEEA